MSNRLLGRLTLPWGWGKEIVLWWWCLLFQVKKEVCHHLVELKSMLLPWVGVGVIIQLECVSTWDWNIFTFAINSQFLNFNFLINGAYFFLWYAYSSFRITILLTKTMILSWNSLAWKMLKYHHITNKEIKVGNSIHFTKKAAC